MKGEYKMNLFKDDKPKTLKIINEILLLWIIGSLIFAINGFVEVLFFNEEKSEITLVQYTREYCHFHEENPTLENCREHWLEEKDELEKEEDWWHVNPLLSAITSSISFVIVTIALVVINLKRKTKK